MCTIGGLGRHYRPTIDRYIGRLSVGNRSKVDRYSTDSRLIVDQCITRYVHIYRSTVGRYIGRQSTDCRPMHEPICAPIFIGRLSADLSVDYRPIVGRLSTDISADMSTEATYSTNDPKI